MNQWAKTHTLTRQPKLPLLQQKVICSFTYVFWHPRIPCLISPLRGRKPDHSWVVSSLLLHPLLRKGQPRERNPSPCLSVCQGRSSSNPEPHSSFRCFLQSSEEESGWKFEIYLLPFLSIPDAETTGKKARKCKGWGHARSHYKHLWRACISGYGATLRTGLFLGLCELCRLSW